MGSGEAVGTSEEEDEPPGARYGVKGLQPHQQRALGQRHPRDGGSCAPDGVACPGRASAAALGCS